MTNIDYYSQHGEDFLLEQIFKGKDQGYFVEIGCLDGIEYSNSYHFELRGWSGLCVEAHNGFIDVLKENRPNSVVVHCAVGAENLDSVQFFANRIGSLSTLVKSEEDRYQQQYEGSVFGHELQSVKMKTLNTIFSEAKVGEIDFMSIDIEGYEEFALKGLDLDKYRPRVLLIEFKDEQHQSIIRTYVLDRGYHLIGIIGCNAFYSTHNADKWVFEKTYGSVSLIHIDSEGHKNVHKAFLLKPNLFRKIANRLQRLLLLRSSTD